MPTPAAGKTRRAMAGFYYFLFTGFGAVYPMLPLFLQEQGLSGTQFSTIMTMGTVVTVLFQPIWGMICDRWHAQKTVLAVTFFLAMVLSLFYPFAGGFWVFLVLFTGMALFHSSGIPIVDSMALGYVQKHGGDYGSLRLWGAIGFAVASWVAGKVAETAGLSSIFWIYAGAMLGCVLLVRGLPEAPVRVGGSMTAGLKQLVRLPRYTMFLAATFLVFGTIQANNSFYGLFFTSIGGSVAGVGLSFLIAAGSEAPFMRVAGRFIGKYGLIPIMVLAALISSLRWVWYGFAPSPELVTALLFVQGISVGLYLPAAAQYVREVSPPGVEVTAMGIYSAIGNGLGSMAGLMAGGIVYDWLGIYATYMLFGGASLVGVLLMFALKFMPERRV